MVGVGHVGLVKNGGGRACWLSELPRRRPWEKWAKNEPENKAKWGVGDPCILTLLLAAGALALAMGRCKRRSTSLDDER